MSDKKKQSGSVLANPQVLTAIITSIVAITAAVIGFLPTLITSINTDEPAPNNTPVFVVVTATRPPATLTRTPTEIETLRPTDTLVPTATDTPQPTNTIQPPNTAIPVMPTSEPPTSIPPTIAILPTTNTPNARLILDDVSLTLLNLSSGQLTLEGVEFVSPSGYWDARSWGGTLYSQLLGDYCLRLRNVSAGPRNPPADCGSLYGLMEVGTTALFWLNAESFDVEKNNVLIATCKTDVTTCDIYIPQR